MTPSFVTGIELFVDGGRAQDLTARLTSGMFNILRPYGLFGNLMSVGRRDLALLGREAHAGGRACARLKVYEALLTERNDVAYKAA